MSKCSYNQYSVEYTYFSFYTFTFTFLQLCVTHHAKMVDAVFFLVNAHVLAAGWEICVKEVAKECIVLTKLIVFVVNR